MIKDERGGNSRSISLLGGTAAVVGSLDDVNPGWIGTPESLSEPDILIRKGSKKLNEMAKWVMGDASVNGMCRNW